jgi:hypothetical protein
MAGLRIPHMGARIALAFNSPSLFSRLRIKIDWSEKVDMDSVPAGAVPWFYRL